MYIKNIKINNFRGIKNLNWTLEQKVNCLIGPGDSTKTTILDAIEMVLYPSYNMKLNDCDFYNCDINNEIVIESTIGDVPEDLLKEEKYGLYIRKFVDNEENDEPSDNDDIFLTIRLTINKFFEQEWKVVNNRSEGKIINYRDRAKIKFGRIGENAQKDFNFGRLSILNKYEEEIDDLDKIILEVYRSKNFSIESGEYEKLTELINKISKTVKEYSIAPKDKFDINIDIANSDFNYSNISIYDGKVPIRLKGTGTKRLMSSAMNINTINSNSIILIDEIEYGLEPYRLRQLIRKLKKLSKNGQIIFTSHSPITIVELTCEDIVTCKNEEGITICKRIPSEFQGMVRAVPEALLSKKVLLTEGKTEYGIIKEFNKYWGDEDKYIEYYGTSFIEGEGNNICDRAQKLSEIGYRTAIFIDSDNSQINNAIKNMHNVEIFKWTDLVSTDEQIFNELPKEGIQELIDVVIEYKTKQSVEDSIKNTLSIPKGTTNFEEMISQKGEKEVRNKLGKLSKNPNQAWFKRVDIGEKVAGIIYKYYSKLEDTSDIKRILEGIKKWSYGS